MKRNWKSLMVSGTVLTVLAGALTLPALASVGQRTAALHYQNIKVTLDGRTLDLTDSRGNEVEPFTIDGTTYLPLASISKALGYAHYLNNPWFQLYPDIGNLSAWDNDVQMELQAGIGHIVAVHVKDTKPGVFKNVPFGEGVVDFERCFETLKQSGYCGPYLIEMWSETAEDPAAEVAKARDWVKARMAKAGMVEAA